MDCADFERIADPLVDGELAERERTEAEGHLSSCPACKGRVEGLRALKRVVKRSADRGAPHHLREAVRARLREERVVRFRPSLRWAPAYAAAAAAVATGIAGYWYLKPNGTRGTAPMMAAAVDNFTKNIPGDVRINDPRQAGQWARERVGCNALPPPLPFPLEHASVRVRRGHPAAAVGYQPRPGRT